MTQQEVARIARVSQSTVSRVLAGDTRVAPRIRDRVASVMRDGNYRPDARARSLRSKRSGLVGLVARRPHRSLDDNSSFAHLVGSLASALSKSGLHLCVDLFESDEGRDAACEELLRSRKVDSLILVEPHARVERMLKVQDEGFPWVLMGNPGDCGDIWSIDNDHVAAGSMAARHLIERGYRRIAMVAGPLGMAVSDDRVQGYRAALLEAGLEPHVVHSQRGPEPAARATAEALSSPKPPDALVVLEDAMALGSLRAIEGAGRSVPETVGVVSFGDSVLCELGDVGLTSMSPDTDSVVATACERILKLVDGGAWEKPHRVLVPCSLVVRGSSLGPTSAER